MMQDRYQAQSGEDRVLAEQDLAAFLNNMSCRFLVKTTEMTRSMSNNVEIKEEGTSG